MKTKSIQMSTIELIIKHARYLYEDTTDNQLHHLTLLQSLIVVALEERKTLG